MTILALDPGNTQTGYAVIEMPGFRLVEFGKIDNDAMIDRIVGSALPPVDTVAIEMVASYGMAVGREVFETCVWIGRFHQAAGHPNTHYVYRKEEKEVLSSLLAKMKARAGAYMEDR